MYFKIYIYINILQFWEFIEYNVLIVVNNDLPYNSNNEAEDAKAEESISLDSSEEDKFLFKDGKLKNMFFRSKNFRLGSGSNHELMFINN